MKPNVKLRSNVLRKGDAHFEKLVRGPDAVIRLLERKHPHLRGAQDRWAILREATVLEPAQVLDVAWQLPCVRCGARPEGLVAGEVEFRCPLNACAANAPRARTINITPELLRCVETTAGDLHLSVQTALERFGGEFIRGTALPPRYQVPVVVRLKPFQHLLYGGFTPTELSDYVEFALLRLFPPQI